MFAKEIQIVNEFLKKDKDAFFYADSFSLGEGEWALVVYGVTTNDIDSSSEFLFELIGSNGTNGEEPADLWSNYEAIMRQVGVPQ
jgi:hypothetical protein